MNSSSPLPGGPPAKGGHYAHQAHDLAGLGALLREVAALPAMMGLLEAQHEEIKALRSEVRQLHACAKPGSDGWLDAKGAAQYMAVSAGTFDKYRYNTNPKIKGFNLDGKTLYKRADLDSFIRLYALKAGGLA